MNHQDNDGIAAEWISYCDDLLDQIDRLPEVAEEFGESVRSKTKSIQAWIAEHNHVTINQQTALRNMQAGVIKWLHPSDKADW